MAGAGIWNSGNLTLIQSSVLGCTVQGGSGGNGGQGNIFIKGNGGPGGNASGGGIWSSGTLSLTQSLLAGNQVNGGNGGQGDESSIFGGNGGDGGDGTGAGVAIASGSTNVQITDSTISGNSVVGGVGINGGLADSKHTSGDGGNGGNGSGGGIYTEANLTLSNSTVALNEAHLGCAGGGGVATGPLGTAGSDGTAGTESGGGVRTAAAGTITSVSSLIGANVAATEADFSGTFAGAAHTLLQDAAGATGITNGANGNLVGQDPKLGPLQDNGGPTLTHALLSGSPAIGTGSNPLNLKADQRGYTSRDAGGAADIGAFEFGAAAPADPARSRPGPEPGRPEHAGPRLCPRAARPAGRRRPVPALADAALKSAGALSFSDLGPTGDDADYVWGNLVATLTTDGHDASTVAPGDMIQFRDVTFVTTTINPDGSWSQSTMLFPHHTAVVESVDKNVITILQQNVDGDMTVRESTINLDDMTQGTMWVYQPTASQPVAPGGDPGIAPVGAASHIQTTVAAPTPAPDQGQNAPATSTQVHDQALAQLGQSADTTRVRPGVIRAAIMAVPGRASRGTSAIAPGRGTTPADEVSPRD